jgi:two-component system chemotaxis response regulator CheY
MKSCLVIDDSSVIRKVARRILEDLDFDVSEAEDGQHWNMPVVGGVEFLAALRSQFAGKKPKVVFCASENDVATIARAMRAGADDYILKPFDREIVEAKLQEVGML